MDGKVMSLINIEEINNNNLSLYSVMNFGKELPLSSTDFNDSYTTEDKLFGLIDNSDYFLIPERDYEASPFYAVNLKFLNGTRDWVWNNIDNFEILKKYKLPNSKTIYLMKKNF